MSDSLRDQLLQAGFKQRTPNLAKSKRNASKRNTKGKNEHKFREQEAKNLELRKKAEADSAAQAKKETKAKIKNLIETEEIKAFSGEEIYRFTLQNRIRELHVNADTRKRLIEGSLCVTRLNGTTRIVPHALIEKITLLNPDWAMVVHDKQSTDSSADDGYEDFPVPDDITW